MNNPFRKQPILKTILLCVISAVLLVLAFPQTDLGVLAWAGLVPFLLALEQKSLWAALGTGYFYGILFFAGTLYWFIHVTLPGMILLVLYFAVYFAVFALGCRLFYKRRPLEKIFYLPCLWVTLEFARAHLFTGFDWVSLGYSQYKNLPLIQIADITGAAGVCFLIVMTNAAITEILKEVFGTQGRLAQSNCQYKQEWLKVIAVVILLFVLTGGYGFYRLNQIRALQPLGQLRVAVIQANIPQAMKWQQSAWPDIMKKYLALTRRAAEEKPDLIIWPETAFPGFIGEAPQLFLELKDFVREIKIPLLLGLVTQRNESYFNSAILLSGDGEVVQQYDKLHLVPFGEYIPLRNIFPFLSHIAPIGDFTSGESYTLFPVPSDGQMAVAQGVYSVLICFEDTVAAISRDFTRKGANLLVNVTNDAWFQDTKAPFLHLQDAVFRSVENRRSLIRSANTGVSCFIEPTGRIIRRLEDNRKKAAYVEGFIIERVFLQTAKTFYTKFGDVFTYLCFGGILGAIITAATGRRVKSRLSAHG